MPFRAVDHSRMMLPKAPASLDFSDTRVRRADLFLGVAAYTLAAYSTLTRGQIKTLAQLMKDIKHG